MPWLLNEDAALKFKLQGIVVSDANSSSRNVPVRYRLPEVEPADLSYPIIVIEHNGWTVANDREHRGFIQLPYAPEGYAPWWNVTGDPATETFDPSDSPYYSYFPLPYNLDYTVTAYARFQADHMMPIVATMASYDRLNAKFGFLDIPQDGTKRTMQLLAGPTPADAYDSNGKRIFVTKWMVRVFSELVPSQIQQFSIVSQVNLDLSVYNDVEDLSGPALEESHGLLSVGSPIAWNVGSPIQ